MKKYLVLLSLLFSFSILASEDSWYCKVTQGSEFQVFEFKNPTNGEWIELDKGYKLLIDAYRDIGEYKLKSYKGTLYNRFMIHKGGFSSPEADSPPSLSFDYAPAKVRVICGSEKLIKKLN